ncbi:FRG domain-containing protein [Candidatus Pantoea symbiotica]|uniref:FRG domain-containing protein n=1 Tax=Candidatus Pantoea symbiotica TaxID=1884370 RepID=A0A1I3UWZ2_9GAMM|nr:MULTISPECIES: FRG domain-containing protein [Pantoea]SFJ87430.1 FRG domain-containing protein [Pantoea symbiotica]SFU61497.1 FRG domain-containing protein [Pantoea sp. YR525]
MIVSKIEINEPKELLNYFLSWQNNFNGIVFRGHNDESWKLTPTSLRISERDRPLYKTLYGHFPEDIKETEFIQAAYEFNYLQKFFIRADLQGLKVPNDYILRNSPRDFIGANALEYLANQQEWPPRTLDELAGLAQHYGIPTRLLDWSYDPFIALYFALKDSWQAEGNLSIWCLDTNLVRVVSMNNPDFPLRIITPPYFNNPNLNAQKGLFTLIPTVEKEMGIVNAKYESRPLDEYMEEKFPMEKLLKGIHPLKHITFPRHSALQAYKYLESHGYGSEKIFPGYKGIADQIMQPHQFP